MAKGFTIQNSFSAGELSPLMYGRTEGEAYRSGCATLENMIADSHGPVRTRNGFEFLKNYSGKNNAAILTSQISANSIYAFVFTIGQVELYSPVGAVWVVNRIKNPRFHQGDKDWLISQVGNDSVVSVEKDTLTVSTGVTRTIIEQQITGDGSVAEDTRLKVHMTTGGKNYRILIGTTQGASDILIAFTSDEIFVHEFAANPPMSGPIWITIEFDATGVQTDVGIFKLHFVELVQFQNGGFGKYQFVSPYKRHEFEEIRFIETPDRTAIYVLHASHPVRKFTYTVATDLWDFVEVTFTAPPAEWVVDNYPAVGVIYQNRLWLGATRLEQTTLWGSKSNTFEDFTTGTNDDDSFNFTLQTNDQIMWVLATKDLVIGASHSEIIVKSTGGVVTQSDIQLQQQSSYGSAPQRPLLLGDQIVYISLDRRKLRVIQYEFRADNWISADLTFTSEHVSKGEIIGVSWQQDPDNLLWLTLRDGNAASLTYDRSNNVYGWHRHNTDGQILSMAAGNYIGHSIVFAAIKRAPNDLNIEVLGIRQGFDSWVEQSLRFGGLVFTGFNHLIGRTVQVFADSKDRIDAGGPSELVLLDDLIVDGSGNITLPEAAYRMVAGLAYTAKFKSLPFDAGSLGGGNTGKTHTKRWSKLFVELNESARPLINNVRPPTRTAATLMDTTENLKTEIIQVTQLGYDKKAEIEISQDLPLPLVIISTFGEIVQDNL